MKIIETKKGEEIKVDNDWYEMLKWIPWYIGKTGYPSSNPWIKGGGKGTVEKMHRIILNLNDSKIHGDHKSGDKLDNRVENLRVVNNTQNIWNKGKRSYRRGDNPKSKFIGVSRDKRENLTKRWTANIRHDGVAFFLGRFKTELEAAIARDKKAKELWGEFARLNIIED